MSEGRKKINFRYVCHCNDFRETSNHVIKSGDMSSAVFVEASSKPKNVDNTSNISFASLRKECLHGTDFHEAHGF
jgi:hypothetical protein